MYSMKKVPDIKQSNNPWFDELELLAQEFPGVPFPRRRKKISPSDAKNQFEKQLNQVSVRQVVIQRNESSFDDSYYM